MQFPTLMHLFFFTLIAIFRTSESESPCPKDMLIEHMDNKRNKKIFFILSGFKFVI